MNSNHARTLSILQRIPAILAVTAASYGLAQTQPPQRGQGPVQGSTQQRQLAPGLGGLQRAALTR